MHEHNMNTIKTINSLLSHLLKVDFFTDIFFKKLMSIKSCVIIVLAILITYLTGKMQTTHGWAFITTDQYKYAVQEAVNGNINGEGTGTFFPLVQIAALNCALTSYEEENQNISGYCPENLTGQTGIIPAIAKINQDFYRMPPANLAYWIKDTGETLGFIPKNIYAQNIGGGVGFSGLQPILDIWKAFRNLSYILISLAIIIVGFMIMFRKKIDPQTVVTIQESIPRIIIVLLFITFSYAISGVFIDLMYVSILLAYNLFLATNIIPSDSYQVTGGPMRLFGITIANLKPLKESILTGDIREAFYIVFPNGLADPFTFASQILYSGSVPGNPLQRGVELVFGGIVGGVLGGFLLNILILGLFVRLFFLYLTTYIRIIFNIIFSPMFFLLDVLPGNNNASKWIRNMMGDLSVFVVSAIIFMISVAFYTRIDGSSFAESMWITPYTSMNSTKSGISSLFTIGILLMLPSIVNEFRNTIKSSEGLSMGSSIGRGLSRAGGFAYNIAFLASQYFRRGERMVNQRGGSGGGGQH